MMRDQGWKGKRSRTKALDSEEVKNKTDWKVEEVGQKGQKAEDEQEI